MNEPRGSVPAFLLMNAGAQSGARFELKPEGKNLLGRDWQCRIVLSDPQSSRIHAEIYRDPDGWWISDNKSSNGTFVNGQPIDNARLVDGTEIRIGSSMFTFQTASVGDGTTHPSEDPTGVTIVLDQSMNPGETGQYTLNFLQGHNWGQDIFFLFQLSVKLLGVDDPDEVVHICMSRLLERTGASVTGFLWLSDTGQLKPKHVYPESEHEKLILNAKLTQRVVKQRHAIRIEHGTSDEKEKYADSICVPLISDDEVKGAVHLYRQKKAFHDSHFELACAVTNIMARSIERANRQASLAAKHLQLVQKSAATDELIGESPAMRDLKSRIERVAKASGCVLIRGESGVGKELVARAIHRASPRRDRPMLGVNCAAIPRDLMESQLFGHKKGAFTSADRDHIGWFQQADLGTLFLDEIGELTLEGQAKLLRTLEGHPFLPVGASEQVSVDVRVICATNRDLKEFVSERRFREDLFYRLVVYELLIPPLRDRGQDIQLLINHFFEHFSRLHGKSGISISDHAIAKLLSYQWPGNVRQLRNVIDSAIVMAEGNEVRVDDLGIRDYADRELETLRIDHWERKLISEALTRTGDNVPKASDLLGISRATLYRKIDEYGIARK
jgi:transcriptional regulator with GAF, ATPase, and Fis domain